VTKKDYRNYLKQASSFGRLTIKQKELARRYAYCYFIQRQIPLPIVKDKNSAWWNLQFDKLDLLKPGKEPFMDFICDKIIDGDDFIMEEKLVKYAESF